jgi:uncharacterized protein
MNEQGYGRDNPYLTGIVELEEGVKISARIVGVDARHPAAVKTGMPLQLDFIDSGEADHKKTSLAFRPA